MEHAQKFADYLIARGQSVKLDGIPAPVQTWDSIEELISYSFNMEADLTSSLQQIYSISERISDTITNNLLREVYVLSNRLRNIKQSFKTTENKSLRERLFSENKNISKRVNEIYKIAILLNKNNTDKFNFSNLLVEITKRTLNENKFESNLFFL